MARAREVAAGILDEAFDAVPVERVRTWVGVAGTITTLSAVALALPEYDSAAVHLSRLSGDDLHRVADELLGMSRERARHARRHPPRPDRRDRRRRADRRRAGAGAARAGRVSTSMVVSEHDILDGIARSIA